MMDPQVAQVVWPWRTPSKAPVDAGRARRRRALIQCAVSAAIATLLTWGLGRYRLGLCVYGIGAVILTCGFLAPRAFDFLERMGQKLAHGVGLGLTWLLLLPFFYLCFVPARLILTFMGKDPMQRCFERKRHSYWVDHKPPKATHPYTRQY